MIDEKFVYVAIALILFGDLSYLVYTIKGRIKPNRVTWFLWALTPLLGFAAQLSQGVGLVSLVTFTFGAVPLLIFFASFLNKKAYWKITGFDLMCGVLSLVGLALWWITQVGNLAILFSIASDGLAGVPTIMKSYRAPETENYWTYLLNSIGGAITLLTIKNWDFAHYGFPLYILVGGATLFVLIKFKLGKKIHLVVSKSTNSRST